MQRLVRLKPRILQRIIKFLIQKNSNDKASKLTSQKGKLWMNPNRKLSNQIFNIKNSNDEATKLTSQKDKLWAHLNRKLSNDEVSKLTSPRNELRTIFNRKLLHDARGTSNNIRDKHHRSSSFKILFLMRYYSFYLTQLLTLCNYFQPQSTTCDKPNSS